MEHVQFPRSSSAQDRRLVTEQDLFPNHDYRYIVDQSVYRSYNAKLYKFVNHGMHVYSTLGRAALPFYICCASVTESHTAGCDRYLR